MTTCTWNFRRHAGRLLVAGSLLAGGIGFVVPPASADQIGNLQAQATALSAKISQLGNQEDALSEQYDAAQLSLQAAGTKVTAATKALSQADAATAKAKNALKQEAIQAYVQGGSAALSASSTNMGNANSGLLRAEYADSLATDQSDAVDSYHLASLQDQAAKQNLEQVQKQQQAQVSTLNNDKQSVVASQSALQATEGQVKGQIATLVAQQQAAALAAAQAAAQARAQQAAQAQLAAANQAKAQQAAQAQAVVVASASTPAAPRTATVAASTTRSAAPAPAPSAPLPVLSGSVTARAIAAALSRVGDPYVWGAAGPGSFDCSGLVMWAYAQAGVSLPHFSGAQYSSGTHIPMSALQPGDLVFFADPGEHVAMYIGGGQIVEAPHTGADVHVVPLYPEFVLAVRVA